MIRRRWRRCAAVGVLLATSLVYAEPEPSRDKARTYLILRLVEALDLPAEKALALRDVFRHWDQEREGLLKRRDVTHEKLRTALAKKPTESTGLQALTDDAVAIDRELATIPERSFAAAAKLLTLEQQARLLVLRRDLQGQVHQAVRHRLRVAHEGAHPPTTTHAADH